MKTKMIQIALLTGLTVGVQAGQIALSNTWRTDGVNTTLSNESSAGASVVQASNRNAYFYQSASEGDFTSESLNDGDQAVLSFTTTMDAAAGANDTLDYRIMIWDETTGGAASLRLDWGIPSPDTASMGVGDNGASTGIGTTDDAVTSAQVPSSYFNDIGDSSTVEFTVTKVSANVFNVELAWDDVSLYGYALSPAGGVDITSIDAVGIRLFGSTSNEYTVSNLSLEVGAADPGTTLTYQLGGDADLRDQAWGENITTNSGVNPTEYSWSFGAPYYYESLSNVVITVTAVETNDAMYVGPAFLAGTLGNSSRLDTNEMVKINVSYVDPDNKLLDLKIDSFGPYWNNGDAEETLFSDGATVLSITNSDNGFMQNYDATGLEQLSLINTATWSMSVYETNNVTFSGLGGLKFEYTVDAEYIVPPAVTNPPVGNIEFSSNWVFEVATSNMQVLASSDDGFSVAMTNSGTSKRFMYQMDANGFNAPFQVGETAIWSFTATAGTSMGFAAGDAYLQGCIWDSGIGSDNGAGFQVDWGTVTEPVIRLGKSNVSGPTGIGAIAGAANSVGSPSNVIDAPGKTADFVISMERVSPTNMVTIMRYDDLAVTNDLSISEDLDSLNELGFRFKQSGDNALVISNMKLDITNPNFDPYVGWASEKGLTEGVNDGRNDDPDSDTMENMLEYALGGNPLVDDAEAFLPTSLQDGNYLNLVYRRRLDADAVGLEYNVYSSINLVHGPITNTTEEAGSVALNSEFEAVTNRVPSNVESQQFMQLQVTD